MATAAEVSVVVCSRDRAELLRGALTGILSASAGIAEVLVVDSASATTDTHDVAVAAGVRVVRAAEPGLSVARNIGVENAVGSIVVFTDDDCLVDSGWIDRLVRHFADERVVAVTGRLVDHTLVDGGRDTAPVATEPPRRFTHIREGLDAGHGAVMAFRRASITGEAGFDERLGAGTTWAGAEDLDMFCRLLAHGDVVVHDPSATVTHVNTRDDSDYAVLHGGYGLGLGALVAKWLRRRPTVGLTLLGTASVRAIRRRVRGRHDPRRRRAATASARGMIDGLVAGLRAPLRGERFAPVTASTTIRPTDPGTPHVGAGR